MIILFFLPLCIKFLNFFLTETPQRHIKQIVIFTWRYLTLCNSFLHLFYLPFLILINDDSSRAMFRVNSVKLGFSEEFFIFELGGNFEFFDSFDLDLFFNHSFDKSDFIAESL
jgi:hypothetical protein